MILTIVITVMIIDNEHCTKDVISIDKRKNFNISETAKILNCSKITIRRKIKEGIINAELKNGKYGKEYVIEKEEILKIKRTVDLPPTPATMEGMEILLMNTIEKILDRLGQQKKEIMPSNLENLMDLLESLKLEILFSIGENITQIKKEMNQHTPSVIDSNFEIHIMAKMNAIQKEQENILTELSSLSKTIVGEIKTMVTRKNY